MKVAVVLICVVSLVTCAALDKAASLKSKDNYGIKKMQKSPNMKVNSEENSDGVICTICTQTIREAKSAIIDHEGDAAQVIGQVCDTLFKKESTEDAVCKSIIDQELPKIVELLKKKIDPEEVCRELYLC